MLIDFFELTKFLVIKDRAMENVHQCAMPPILTYISLENVVSSQLTVTYEAYVGRVV